MRTRNVSSLLLTSAFATTLAVSGAAFGQCSITPPPGTIVSPDGCGSTTGGSDSNGGCNATPATFTDLGSVASGATIYVSGQFGTYDPTGAGTNYNNRDLDWYTVSTPAGTTTLTLTTQNSAATAQMPASVMFYKKNVDPADPCLGAFNYGVQSTACPFTTSFVTTAGMHLVVVTTPFEASATVPPYVYNCGNYLLAIAHTPLAYAVCGTSTVSCTEVHGTGGCNLPACCETVCNFNPLCCDIGWDAACVQSAITDCGLFVYNCAPPAGAPANDCAINAQLISIGQTGVVANNANCGTDGPGPASDACAAATGKDLWYKIKATGNGILNISGCAGGSATTDSVFEVYRLGTDPVMTAARAQTLPDLYIGCDDDACGVVGGASSLSISGVVANEFYLIRVGGWYDDLAGDATTAATFSLAIDTSLQFVVATSGSQHSIYTAFPQTTLGNLGLSSGCISAASQQRWLATPFTTAGSSAWAVSKMTVKGFTPAGNTNTSLNYVIWRRLAGNPKPTAAEQFVAGSVAFPTPYDTAADDAATASHDILANFNLPSGNYYLTTYASNPSCATVFSNFAWFISAYDGVNLIDATGVFAWRAVTFPSPGFARYTLPATYAVVPPGEASDLYNTAFDILGTPAVTACPGDLNSDQVRNGLDLTVILSNWGSTGGDCNGDGTTNGLDLTVLLSGWGACP